VKLEEFLALLGEMKEGYRGLQAMARRQQELMAAGDVPNLQELVDRKQKEMARLAELSARSQKGRRELGALAPDGRDAVNGALEEVQAELKALLALEEESQKALLARRDDTGGKLKTLHQGRKARDLYGGGGGPSRFLDHGG
jgi:flagellar biosynthesis/type III secretory pathway chaperone